MSIANYIYFSILGVYNYKNTIIARFVYLMIKRIGHQQYIPGGEVFRSTQNKLLVSVDQANKTPAILLEIANTIYARLHDTLGHLDEFYRIQFTPNFPFLEEVPHHITDDVYISFVTCSQLAELTQGNEILIPTINFKEPKALFQFLKSVGQNYMGMAGAAVALQLNREKIASIISNEDQSTSSQGNTSLSQFQPKERNPEQDLFIYVQLGGYTPPNDFSYQTDSHEAIHCLDPYVFSRMTLISELIAFVGETTRDFERNRKPINLEELKEFDFSLYARFSGCDINDPNIKLLLDLDPSKNIDAGTFDNEMKKFLVRLTTDTGLRNDELTRLMINCTSLDDLIALKEAVLDRGIFKDKTPEQLSMRQLFLIKLQSLPRIIREEICKSIHETRQYHETPVRRCLNLLKMSRGYSENEFDIVLDLLESIELNLARNFPTFVKILEGAKQKSPKENKQNIENLRGTINYNLENTGTGDMQFVTLIQKRRDRFILKKFDLREMMHRTRSTSPKVKEFNSKRNSKIFQKAFEKIGKVNLSSIIFKKLSLITQNHLDNNLTIADIERLEKNSQYEKLWQRDKAKLLDYIYGKKN